MSFSDFQVHAWLEEQRTVGKYVALHFDSPIHAGAYASEISGDGYVRQAATFTTPSNRSMWNSSVVTFVGLVANRVTWIGGWDAKTGGNLRWYCELPEPRRILQGGGLSLQPNEIALSFA